MAYISVTNSFTTLTTGFATQVNSNFTDIIDGLTDGTKDINVAQFNADTLSVTTADVISLNANSMVVSALTCAGTAAFGNVQVRSALTSGATPITNAVYNNNTSRAWAYTSASGTIKNGMNLSCSIVTTVTGLFTAYYYNYAILNPPSSSSYVLISYTEDGGTMEESSRSANTFTIYKNFALGSLARTHTVMIYG